MSGTSTCCMTFAIWASPAMAKVMPWSDVPRLGHKTVPDRSAGSGPSRRFRPVMPDRANRVLSDCAAAPAMGMNSTRVPVGIDIEGGDAGMAGDAYPGDGISLLNKRLCFGLHAPDAVQLLGWPHLPADRVSREWAPW